MRVRITKLRLAAAGLLVLTGVGLGSLLSPLVGTALATAGQIVNISDRSGSTYFAKVSSDGKLAMGDGAGPLSVDGTVAGRPAAPVSPWRAAQDIQGAPKLIAGPSLSPINVTSLTISTGAPTGQGIAVLLYAYHVPATVDFCNIETFDVIPWKITDVGDGTTPVSFSFPTPLQVRPPTNTKGCLYASAQGTSAQVAMNAVGFYGG
jgi:hypothetical protein